MKKINILFPIEAINREFDYRLLLALRLVDKNINIIMAQHDYFNKNSKNFRGGIYLGKNVFKSTFPRNSNESNVNLQYYRELKKNEIIFCHLDEEGAVYFGDEEYWKIELGMRLNPKVMSSDDYIFTWGEFQSDYYKSVAGKVPIENIITTGHPRLELNKKEFSDYYKDEKINLNKKFGNYILINMNMGYANNIFGLSDTFSTRLGYNCEDPELRMHLVNTWAHFNNKITEFVKLIHSLSITYPGKSFVIRPHPAEDINFYKVVFNGVKNIFVENSGPVNVWILAADLVIHDGCTTGIEAFIGGIPVINYKSLNNADHDLWLPNQLGIKCVNEKEVIDVISKLEFKNNRVKKAIQNQEKVERLIENIKRDIFEVFASNFNAVIEKKFSDNKYDGNISIFRIVLSEYLNNIFEALKSVARIFMPDKRKRFFALKSAFPGFKNKRVLSKIQRLRADQIKIKVISNRLIVITK